MPGVREAFLVDPQILLERARDLFSRGNARLLRGENEEALGFFLRSREILRSHRNTLNAAICLERLKRNDQAFEMYEELLRDFNAQLNAQQTAAVTAKVNELGKELGRVKISSNVDGRVLIDDRERSLLPRKAPIYVIRGEHHVRIVRDGHVPFEITVDVPANAIVGVNAELKRIEPTPEVLDGGPVKEPPRNNPPPESPFAKRPPKPSHGGWQLGAFGGYGGGSTLNSDAELNALSNCTADCPGASGFLTGIRGGYLFDFGLAIEITGGYMAFSSAFEREERSATVTYMLQDDVRFQGGFGGFGFAYRLMLNSPVDLLARATAGLISARSADPVRAHAVTAQESAEVFVAGRSQVLVSQPGFVMPEVGAEIEWARMRLGLLVGLLLVLPNGPTFRGREIGVNPPTCTGPGDLGCTPNSGILTGERAYGLFQIWIPQFTVGYTFEPAARRRIRR